MEICDLSLFLDSFTKSPGITVRRYRTTAFVRALARDSIPCLSKIEPKNSGEYGAIIHLVTPTRSSVVIETKNSYKVRPCKQSTWV